MGKRRRNTAKTGDKAISKKGAAAAAAAKGGNRRDGHTDDSDNDPMYGDVDRFYNAQEEEFLRLDRGDDNSAEDDDDDDDDQVEGVLNLASADYNRSSDDDSNDDGDSDDDDDKVRQSSRLGKAKIDFDDDDAAAAGTGRDSDSADDSDEELLDDDDDDDDGALEATDVRDWGKKKSSYYYGDTADLEIGQDEQDAYLEEAAAKEVQAARLQDMSEADFMLSDQEDNDPQYSKESDKKPCRSAGAAGGMEKLHATQDYSQLPRQAQRRILDQRHPELLPLLGHFTNVVRDGQHQTWVATKALFLDKHDDDGDDLDTAKAVGATPLGQEYLLAKAMIQSSAALNLAMYLLLKLEHEQSKAGRTCAAGDSAMVSHDDDDDDDDVDDSRLWIQSHPVMMTLQKLHDILERLEDQVESKIPGLTDQLRNLVKAARLMKSDNFSQSSSSSSTSVNDRDAEDSDNESLDDPKGTPKELSSKPAFTEGTLQADLLASHIDDDGDKEKVDRYVDKEDNAVVPRDVIDEARYGLRRDEIVTGPKRTPTALADNSRGSRSRSNQLRQRQQVIQASMDYMGDEHRAGDGRNQDISLTKKKKAVLASTLNSIEQRSTTVLHQQRRGRLAPAEEEDVNIDDYAESGLQQGLDQMEAELGVAFREEDDNNDDDDDRDHGKSARTRQRDGREHDADDDDKVDAFYHQMTLSQKARKQARKAQFQVAPKFPRVEGLVEGERAIDRAILKNRGLVAHKSRLNRNPRVKKREQYRRALIRRKGAVREVRTEEAHNYGGEMTGIKSRLSRSRKLA